VTSGNERATSVVQLVRASAEMSPAAPAVVAADGSTVLAYSGLLARVTDLAIELREAGVGPTDVVLVSMANGPDNLVAILACMAAAVCAPMNPGYSLAEIELLADDTNATAVVVANGAPAAARELAASRALPCIEVISGKVSPLRQPDHQQFDPAPGDIALLLHTAGTTSRPKQVPLSHANLVAAANNVVASLALTPADRCLNVMPLFHSHGLLGAALSTLAAGASIVCPESMDRRYFVKWAAGSEATWYTAASTIHQLVLESPGEWRGFRFLRSASGPLAPQVAVALEARFGSPMIEVYGMTEAYQITANPLSPGERRIGSVGRPTGTEVRVIDAQGGTVATGIDGEIAVRGPAVFAGYSAPAAANDDAFVDGWFRTGDVGRFSDDGFLTITGRIKEQINRGGEKISPREVDEALLSHPDIVEAMAFAIPDPLLGEEIGAAIVAVPGAEVDLVSVRRFLRDRIAPFKIPRRLLLVEQLPKSSTGKLLRIGFAAQHADELRATTAPADADLPADDASTQGRLAALWAELLELPAAPELSDNFFDLGGTSLLTMELVIRIEELFLVDVPVTEIIQVPTLAEMAARIDQPSNGQQPTSLLVPFRVQAGGPTVVLVPGAEGMGIGMRSIALALDPQLDVYLFDYPGHRVGGKPAPAIETIAAALVEELVNTGIHHDLALYGNSLGGWVVFDAARRLAEAGHPPQLVGVGDMFSPAFNSRDSPTRPSMWKRVRNRARRLRAGARLHTKVNGSQPVAAATSRRDAVFAASQKARRTYSAQPYGGNLIVFRARQRAEKYGGTLGWGQHVSGEITVVDLLAGHSEMHVAEAHTIAGTINRALRGSASAEGAP